MATRVTQDVDEWRLLTRAIAILALLTGLVYTRAILGGSLVGPRPAWVAGPGGAILLTLGALSLATAGLIIAWRWEGSGGLIAVAGGVLLGGLVYRFAAHDAVSMGIFYGSPFVVAGALFLACWWRCRAERRSGGQYRGSANT